ncbi:hypothetical protein M8C13_20040 [Crossiella sp. SN42]|uniref:hypothetical protein n=1 Tax=Crossiella sp. SN42 TaxID=2944808 RepID=UPI00207CA4DF|nr:hypothetical protein [Crossiella sp. SN42]MCO1578047.1 hypothetical protein [Crossiella sp. SN42]
MIRADRPTTVGTVIDLTGLAVLLAVVGACCYAAAARVQHSAVQATGDGANLRLATLWRLVRDPRWLLGLALLGGGTVLHAIAVAIGPLIVVQPVGVLALVLAAVLDARQTGRRINAAVLTPVLTATLGMGGFVAFAAGSATGTPPAGALTDVLLFGALGVAALMIIGSLTRGNFRCLALGAGGGVAYGVVSVLVRLTAHQFQAGAGISWLAVAGVAAALLGGGWCVQQAYASGRPHHVVACLTVLDPLVAVAMGVGLLGEAAGTTPWVAVAELTCAAVALAGVTLLALAPGTPSLEVDDQRAPAWSAQNRTAS